MKDNLKIIQELHKTDFKFVIVSSGGGSNAVGTLLKVPGASNSVLEAYIPYAKESLDFYLLRKPDFYCSKDTTLRMAARAYSAAKKIDPNSDVSTLFGVAITATLSTTYEKKGEHRFHIALQTETYSKNISCVLKKGERTREEEEALVTEFVIALLAESSALEYPYPKISEEFEAEKVEGKKEWIDLMSDDSLFVSSNNKKPNLIFPGTFNPIHEGHRKMQELAEKKTGDKAYFEICIQNADKPPLSYHHIKDTLSQFTDKDCWVLTKAGKFPDKAKMFKGSTFVIGADTLTRMLDERFYPSRKDMLSEFSIFNENNNKFLVFGRKLNEKFITLADIDVPEFIKERFTGFDEQIFRDDISSTSLRLAENS